MQNFLGGLPVVKMSQLKPSKKRLDLTICECVLLGVKQTSCLPDRVILMSIFSGGPKTGYKKWSHVRINLHPYDFHNLHPRLIYFRRELRGNLSFKNTGLYQVSWLLVWNLGCLRSKIARKVVSQFEIEGSGSRDLERQPKRAFLKADQCDPPRESEAYRSPDAWKFQRDLKTCNESRWTSICHNDHNDILKW